jgi:hypothetical protein
LNERLKELRKQAGDAFDSAKNAWKAKDAKSADRALVNYGKIRGTYDRIAAEHGLPPLNEPSYGSSFKGFTRPGGRRTGANVDKKREVKDGMIKVISAEPIP